VSQLAGVLRRIMSCGLFVNVPVMCMGNSPPLTRFHKHHRDEVSVISIGLAIGSWPYTLSSVDVSLDHDIRCNLPHFALLGRKQATMREHARVQHCVRPAHSVTSLPMHADDIDPVDVGHRVGDKSVHIVPIPCIPLSIKNRADSRRILGRNGGCG